MTTGAAQRPPAGTGWWRAGVLTAVAMLVTLVVLGQVLALLGSVPGLGAGRTVVLGGALAAAAFGADVVVDTHVDGAGDLTASLGLLPLTLTLATLAVGVLVLRRSSRTHASLRDDLRAAAGAAVLAAVGVAVVALASRTDVEGVPVRADALGGAVGTLLSVAVVLGLGVLRADRLPPRWAAAYDRLRPPVLGLVAVALALPVAGALAALCLLAWHEDAGSGSELLAGVELRHEIALAVALAGNGGLWALSLGSLGEVGLSGFEGLRGLARLSGAVEVPDPAAYRGGVGYLAGDLGLTGLWVCLVLAPAVLAVGVAVVLRTARPGTRPAALGLWLVALLPVLPGLGLLADARLGVDLVMLGEDSGRAGVLLPVAALLVLGYALLVALVGLLVSGAYRDLRRSPAPLPARDVASDQRY